MKRPWNRDYLSVFSLLSYSKNNEMNMNICTYVSVVNMSPKTYAISIEYSSLTYDNIICNNSNVVLQALGHENINIVKVLGKKTGVDFNKKRYLQNRGLLSKWRFHDVLKDTAYVIELKYLNKFVKMEDHCLFLFKMITFKNYKNKLLTLNDLINKKIIL